MHQILKLQETNTDSIINAGADQNGSLAAQQQQPTDDMGIYEWNCRIIY